MNGYLVVPVQFNYLSWIDMNCDLNSDTVLSYFLNFLLHSLIYLFVYTLISTPLGEFRKWSQWTHGRRPEVYSLEKWAQGHQAQMRVYLHWSYRSREHTFQNAQCHHQSCATPHVSPSHFCSLSPREYPISLGLNDIRSISS